MYRVIVCGEVVSTCAHRENAYLVLCEAEYCGDDGFVVYDPDATSSIDDECC